MMTFRGATREPIAELRKLAASFITPIKRPVMARTAMTISIKV